MAANPPSTGMSVPVTNPEARSDGSQTAVPDELVRLAQAPYIGLNAGRLVSIRPLLDASAEIR